MKSTNQVLALAGVVAALLTSAGFVEAQQQDGGGGGRRGGRGGGNFDPAQAQQFRMDNYRQRLELTKDEEWSAIQPLIQKVVDAQQEAAPFSGRGGGRGGFGGGGGGGGGGGFGGTPNPTVEALQTAIDSNATDQIKTALAKYREARKQAQDKLTAAQDALKKVLTLKQEAVALRLGLVS